MYVVVTFPYSFNLELTISELVQKGYDESSILAIPMQPFHRSESMIDMMSEDAATLFDLSLVFGTMGMLLGVIYGYALPWGPILWGLIGLVGGGAVGFLIKIAMHRRRLRNWQLPTRRQVILMIKLAEKTRVAELECLLKPYEPTGFATLHMDEEQKSQ